MGEARAGQQYVGGAFDIDPKATPPPGMDGGHELSLGIKGKFGHPGKGLVQVGLPKSLLGGGFHQGDLGGIPYGTAFPQGRVTAEGRGGEELPAVGPRRGPGLADRHSVLGEGACLIRADHPGAAQGLYGELFHNGPLLGQPLDPKG